MPRTPLPIRFSLDGHPISGEAHYTEAGAQVLVFTSCSAELGIELRSAYLAGERRSEVLVAESAVIGAGPADLSSARRLEGAGDVHTYERRRLLYDHLQRLQDLAASAGWALGVEGLSEAVVQLDVHIASPPSS